MSNTTLDIRDSQPYYTGAGQDDHWCKESDSAQLTMFRRQVSQFLKTVNELNRHDIRQLDAGRLSTICNDLDDKLHNVQKYMLPAQLTEPTPPKTKLKEACCNRSTDRCCGKTYRGVVVSGFLHAASAITILGGAILTSFGNKLNHTTSTAVGLSLVAGGLLAEMATSIYEFHVTLALQEAQRWSELDKKTPDYMSKFTEVMKELKELKAQMAETTNFPSASELETKMKRCLHQYQSHPYFHPDMYNRMIVLFLNALPQEDELRVELHAACNLDHRRYSTPGVRADYVEEKDDEDEREKWTQESAQPSPMLSQPILDRRSSIQADTNDKLVLLTDKVARRFDLTRPFNLNTTSADDDKVKKEGRSEAEESPVVKMKTRSLASPQHANPPSTQADKKNKLLE